jgi:hypothetical protein
MTIEQLAEYLGLPTEALETEDGLREAFDKLYLKREQAHLDKKVKDTVFGSVNGKLRSKLKAAAKTLGIELNVDELDPTEAIEQLGTAMQGQHQALQAEIAAAKKDGRPEERKGSVRRASLGVQVQVR